MIQDARRTGARRPSYKALWIAAGAGLAAGIALAACGGSSSESPWPVEPESQVLGPEGEEGKPRTSAQRVDAGPDTGPNVEP